MLSPGVSNEFQFIAAMRRLYRARLSRFSAFRWLKDLFLIGYWTLFRMRRTVLSASARTYSFVSASAWRAGRGESSIVFEPAMRISIPGPQFVGYWPPEHSRNEIVEIEFPSIELTKVDNAIAIGGTNFVLTDRYAVHPDLYLPAREVCPAETFGIVQMQLGMKSLKFQLPARCRKVGAAASLLGQCAGNYAHWLVEVLPKLLVLDSYPDYRGLPLLVDGWVHPNFHESLRLLNHNQRELILVDRWEPVMASSVLSVSPTAYIPAEYRSYLVTGQIPLLEGNEFPFSQAALLRLRQALLEAVPARRRMRRKKRKFYIRRERHGNDRRALNFEEAEAIAVEHDFEVVEPGGMTFIDQVELFRDASVVAGQIGAALVNTLFSQPGCKIVAMAPYYPNANYYFWSNFLSVIGHELHYVVGPQVVSNDHVFHRSYNADMSAFEEAIEQVCS